MERRNNKGLEECLVNEIEAKSWTESKPSIFLKNLAVNTSVKYGTYFIPLATMEYYKMQDIEKVKNARLMALAIDTVGATLYKGLSEKMDHGVKYLNKKFGRHPEREIVKLKNMIRRIAGKENLTYSEMKNTYKKTEVVKKFTSDAIAMNAVYGPLYYGALNLAGATPEQAQGALINGAIIGTSTSRPFRKYCLQPWRKYWSKKIKLE